MPAAELRKAKALCASCVSTSELGFVFVETAAVVTGQRGLPSPGLVEFPSELIALPRVDHEPVLEDVPLFGPALGAEVTGKEFGLFEGVRGVDAIEVTCHFQFGREGPCALVAVDILGPEAVLYRQMDGYGL